jgi:hypothetical protein
VFGAQLAGSRHLGIDAPVTELADVQVGWIVRRMEWQVNSGTMKSDGAGKS